MALHWRPTLRAYLAGVLTGAVIAFAGVVAFFVIGDRILESRHQARIAAQRTGVASRLEPPALQPTVASETVDLRLTLEDYDGNRVDLSSFAGRFLVINVWATWCVPCQAELPTLESLAHMFAADDRVAVLLLSLDSREAFRRYFQGRPVPARMYRLVAGPPAWAGAGVPRTLLIDPKRTVLVSELGAADWSHVTVRRFIARRLEGSQATEGHGSATPAVGIDQRSGEVDESKATLIEPGCRLPASDERQRRPRPLVRLGSLS